MGIQEKHHLIQHLATMRNKNINERIASSHPIEKSATKVLTLLLKKEMHATPVQAKKRC
jgi:hypothetical protein